MRSWAAFISLIVFFGFSLIYAQDVIFLNNGTEINAKVTEIGDAKITYLKSSNIDGPIYKINISEVKKVKYENGFEETFSNNKIISEKELNKIFYADYSIKINKDDFKKVPEAWKKYNSSFWYYAPGMYLATAGGVMLLGGVPYALSTDEYINPWWFIGPGVGVVAGALLVIKSISVQDEALKIYQSQNSTSHIFIGVNRIGVKFNFQSKL